MDYDVQEEFKKLYKQLKCKAKCSILNDLTFSDGLTRTANNVTFGGDLSGNSTIETSGNNFLFEETASNLQVGIFENPISSTRSWNVIQSEGDITYLFVSKLDAIPDPISVTNYFIGVTTLDNVSGDFASSGSGYDNVNSIIFAEMLAVTATDSLALRLDGTNGLRFFSNTFDIFQATLDGNFVLPQIGTYLNDAAAAIGGVPINGVYRETATGYVKARIV